jgi:hypothetical protein
MKATAVLPLVGMALVLGACGSGGTKAASPAETIAGVGVALHGPAPRPNTRSACGRRWNGSANASGRAAAMRRAPKADTALVRTAGSTGYFSEAAGRCSIYLLTPPRSAVVFVETARGRFAFAADASGRFSANAKLSPSGRVR